MVVVSIQAKPTQRPICTLQVQIDLVNHPGEMSIGLWFRIHHGPIMEKS